MNEPREPDSSPTRRPRSLVYIVDGTLSSLKPGHETNAGLTWRLLSERSPSADLVVDYHPGVQGKGLGRWLRAASGQGVNDAVIEGYSRLASRYRPGDRIFLFGFSRGAYAVRSLAGLVDRVGLLRSDHAIERRVRRAFRLYERGASGNVRAFARRHCHPRVEVEMIGVWDTVKALGLPYPVLSYLHPWATEFHDHDLGSHIRSGYHALGLDEDRVAFRPVMWNDRPGWRGELEQRWFPGAHGDVGGQLGGFAPARPLSNLPLVWMLAKAEEHGLPLPQGWRERFDVDPTAPMAGAWRGLARMFLLRRRRTFGTTAQEDLHGSVAARVEAADYRPLAEGLAP